MPDDPRVESHVVRGPHGKLIDVHRPPEASPSAPTVLLWHGSGPDERDVLRPLARAVAAHGLPVFVPDWRSDAPDRGRAHLLDSLTFTRGQAASHGGDPDRIVLAGWSASAPAAMGIALRPEAVDGWRTAAVVGIASRYDIPARTTGTSPTDDLAAPDAAAPVPVALVHGTDDTVLAVEHTRTFAAALGARGWSVALAEPPTDHAGAVMTTYDPQAGRCVPATGGHALDAGTLTARVIARAAGVR
ncbi:alpha/beta hydrolase [Streptomyces sp. G45]|uniref:alpha/beta hydrolase n=1 Tax=Streptomyces sp. G45 TaxID=3406627 RepID=UPI003C157FD2